MDKLTELARLVKQNMNLNKLTNFLFLLEQVCFDDPIHKNGKRKRNIHKTCLLQGFF